MACEYSGIVREAFAAKGHDAWSCDILPTEIGGKDAKHFQMDVREILGYHWDLMIGHPPCTYISYAATKYWYQPGRAKKRLEALDFFLYLWEAPIHRICLENPVGCANEMIEKYTQIVHPYYFGDSDMKRTCLWLKNLPPLIHSPVEDLFGSVKTHVAKPEPIYIDKTDRKKKRYFTDAQSSAHKRSKSFPGIAQAMADQWG